MTEIQEIIANLEGKVKKQVEELSKMRQAVACQESLVQNNIVELKKIVDNMETR